MFTLQLLPLPKAPGDAPVENRKTFTKDEKQAIHGIQKELQVLQEQSKQVEVYLVEATSRRRFEDAQMLKESLDELAMEISRKRKELAATGWTGP